MTNNHHGSSSHYRTPNSIRDETFQRRMRGLDADEVYEYLDLLADQVQAMEKEFSLKIDESRVENERLEAELRRVQAELDEYEQAGDRVSEQAVQLFSQAQLVAEQMVEDITRDARERIGQARAHERKIVEEAVSTAGQHVRSYARSAQAQMQSIMDSFAQEVDRIGSSATADDAAVAQAQRFDPLFDELGDWQTSFQAPGHPGSD